ncbi:MAG TPA: tetratricopeptide repeat protein [Pirellulales bacterium]
MPDTCRGLAESPVGRASPWRTAILALVVAVAAAGVITCRFAPRFGLWRGLSFGEDLPWGLRHEPELDRALVSLAQLDDPCAPITNPTHQVIAWRLFFPVSWHFFHLPRSWYVALPQIGCVLALWGVAWLTHQRFGRWWPTCLATGLFAALPWFFVSSSWLVHFDSWLTIGLLTAAFAPSRWLLAFACLITPWVDERFVLALPATMAVRAIARRQIEQKQWRELLLDLVVATVASVPYPAIRAVAWLRGDPGSTAYVKDHLSAVRDVAWTSFAKALWSGYRAGWLVIGAAIVLVWRRVGAGWALTFVFLVIGTAVGGLFIAADMSRSLMMSSPAFLLSIWLCEEWRLQTIHKPLPGRPAMLAAMFLPAVVLANLSLPAYHVMWMRSWQVETLATEIKNWIDPPPLLVAGQDLIRGRQFLEQGSTADALRSYDSAILHAEGAYPLALIERANLRIQNGNISGAESDVNDALREVPDYPFALLLRAAFRLDHGQASLAAADLQRALSKAPADWPYREKAQSLLEKATGNRTPQNGP